jgi:hypothetical protein
LIVYTKKVVILKKWIILVVLVTMLSMSGCVEEKEEQSAASKNIELATSLMASGDELIEDLDTDSPTDARNRLYAAKVSYEESLELLENTSTEDLGEQKLIDVNTIICDYYLESIAAEEDLLDCYDHLSKARTYISLEEYDEAYKEISKFGTSVDSAMPNLENAKELSSQMEMDDVPLELKPVLIYDRESVYTNLDISSEFLSLEKSLYSQVDGFKNQDKALEYMDEEEWGDAQTYFEYTVSNFTETRDILADLEDSEYSELSITSIESVIVYNASIAFAEHCGKACGYMDDNNYDKADEEFDLALEVYE